MCATKFYNTGSVCFVPFSVLNETYTLDPVLEAGHHSYGRTPGVVMVMGQGDVGQLGLGERVIEKKRPCKVGGALEGVRLVQVECGGMHSVALSSDGKVCSCLPPTDP